MPRVESKQLVKDDVIKIVAAYLKASAFTDRKLTDMPTDALQVVSRKYVTLNGVTANRPSNPVAGQYYFDASLGTHGKPIWYTGANWVDATSTIV